MEEKQIPPDKTPREVLGRRDSPATAGRRASSGAHLSVPDDTRGSGEMFPATVLVFQSSHDPSTALGMTEKERPRDRMLAGKLAMETLLVKTERRTQLADVTATFHRRRLPSATLAFYIFRRRSEPTQKRNGNYQNEDEQSQQTKLGHASSKYAGALSRPRSTF